MRLRSGLALLGGAVLCLIGITAIVAYLFEAVIAKWGEADQSLLFRYLPLLFFGIIALGIGLVPLIPGVRQLAE